MASILLIGADVALLEGLAQALVAAGHHVLTAASLAEASFVTATSAPLLAVVDRSLLRSAHDVHALRLTAGGAVVTYGNPASPLTGHVRRVVLAELRLPLERARLAALATHVEARLQHTGRDTSSRWSPESEVKG